MSQTAIRLDWETRDLAATQDPRTGRWRTVESPAQSLPTIDVQPESDEACAGLIVAGDRIEALRAVRRTTRRSVRLGYLDLPRLEGYDEERAFQGTTAARHNTWLSLVRTYVELTRDTLARDGVLVMQCGEAEAHLAHLVAQEVFGLRNKLGTIIWRTHYSPKGGKASDEIASVHEYLITWARDAESIGRIALPTEPEGYENKDDDPRGPYDKTQKDAGRDTSNVTYEYPPYRWRLTSGDLPPGLWRVSPMSGVIWGEPTVEGQYEFTVEVSDDEGTTSEMDLSITVGPDGKPGDQPDSVWWIESPPEPASDLEITTSSLPDAVVGEPYSAVLKATGGSPWLGTTRPKRGWAFGQATLNRAILEDRCYFGVKGTAIPQPKKYLNDLEGGRKLVNVVSFWDGSDVGWTQDATKHLDQLREAGILEESSSLSKPEQLLRRLVDIFTDPGDTVLELFGRTGDMSATALKSGRRAVVTSGLGPVEERARSALVEPRLDAILNGLDVGIDGEPEKGETRLTDGILRTAVLTGCLASPVEGLDYAPLEPDAANDELARLVARAEGYMTGPNPDGFYRSWDGTSMAYVMEPHEFATTTELSRLIELVPAEYQFTLYCFRMADDLRPEDLPIDASVRRVPMDLAR